MGIEGQTGTGAMNSREFKNSLDAIIVLMKTEEVGNRYFKKQVKFIWRARLRIANIIMKNKVRGLTNFKTYCQATVTKTM